MSIFLSGRDKIPVEKIQNDLTRKHKLRLLIKREDLLHHFISGNKFRKLKYNLVEAKKARCDPADYFRRCLFKPYPGSGRNGL